MIAKLIGWWRAKQRAMDMEILWPECKRLAPDLDTARAAFVMHAFNDKAWTSLGHDAMFDAIDNLH